MAKTGTHQIIRDDAELYTNSEWIKMELMKHTLIPPWKKLMCRMSSPSQSQVWEDVHWWRPAPLVKRWTRPMLSTTTS